MLAPQSSRWDTLAKCYPVVLRIQRWHHGGTIGRESNPMGNHLARLTCGSGAEVGVGYYVTDKRSQSTMGEATSCLRRLSEALRLHPCSRCSPRRCGGWVTPEGAGDRNDDPDRSSVTTEDPWSRHIAEPFVRWDSALANYGSTEDTTEFASIVSRTNRPSRPGVERTELADGTRVDRLRIAEVVERPAALLVHQHRGDPELAARDAVDGLERAVVHHISRVPF